VGWASQFGFSLADGAAQDAFQRIKACRHLVPCGLHLHLGTGLRDTLTYFQATRETLDLALELQSGEGVTIEHFDFGGGFNVPTVRELSSFDRKFMNHGFQVRPPRPEATPAPAAYAEGIVSLVEAYRARAGGPVPEIFLEPGRALSSSAQCLLLTVLAVRPGNSHGKFAIVDGGRNVSMPLAQPAVTGRPQSAIPCSARSATRMTLSRTTATSRGSPRATSSLSWTRARTSFPTR
jgi:diaminopimelate decarboxylase